MNNKQFTLTKTALDVFHFCKMPCALFNQVGIIETTFNKLILTTFRHQDLMYLIYFTYPQKFVFKLSYENDNKMYAIQVDLKIEHQLIDLDKMYNSILECSRIWHNVYKLFDECFRQQIDTANNKAVDLQYSNDNKNLALEYLATQVRQLNVLSSSLDNIHHM